MIVLPRVKCFLSSNECHLSVKASIVEKYADVYCTKVNHFMWQKMMPLLERNIQGNANGDVTPVRLVCQCAVVRESRVMLSAAKHLLAHGERPFPFVPQGFGSRAQGDNRVRVVCWRVVSGRGKFESEWSPVARVARVVGVVGVAGIAGELSEVCSRMDPSCKSSGSSGDSSIVFRKWCSGQRMMVMRGVTDVVFGGDLFCGGLVRWVVKGHGLNCPFGGWSSFNSGAGEKRTGEKRAG